MAEQSSLYEQWCRIIYLLYLFIMTHLLYLAMWF